MISSSQLPFDFSIKNEFTFDNFIVCEANLELVSLLKKPNELKEQFYFIWGEQGVGKSHLLQAFCQQTDNSVYVPLTKFFEYGPSILDGLENMDLVCLDDIQCLLKNKEWEESLFEFFNIMREKAKKLFISASASPRNLNPDLKDLASRLSWGVVYQLHELDDKAKIDALHLRAQSRGMPLNDDVLNYIFLRSSRSMNALFSVLDKLDHLSLAEKRRITIPFVKNIMQW